MGELLWVRWSRIVGIDSKVLNSPAQAKVVISDAFWCPRCG